MVVNAKTVLHLNQTAAEMAYHMVRNDPEDVTARNISKRYNVPFRQALDDTHDFQERIQSIIETPLLDPVTFLDFDRVDPYSQKLSAPYRLDCALTYKSGGEDSRTAPEERVKRELITEEWKAILLKSWQAGIPQIVFTGGEPTLRPDLCELITITQNQGQVTGLLTDGKRLAETGLPTRIAAIRVGSCDDQSGSRVHPSLGGYSGCISRRSIHDGSRHPHHAK